MDVVPARKGDSFWKSCPVTENNEMRLVVFFWFSSIKFQKILTELSEHVLLHTSWPTFYVDNL